jgi:hypothetical protein
VLLLLFGKIQACALTLQISFLPRPGTFDAMVFKGVRVAKWGATGLLMIGIKTTTTSVSKNFLSALWALAGWT